MVMISNFRSGSKFLAGVVIVVLVLSMSAISQAALFNLDVSCTTPPYGQGSIPGSSPIIFHVKDIDKDFANTGDFMGSFSVDYETTSGLANLEIGSFGLWTSISEMSNGSVYAYFSLGTHEEDVVSLNAMMPEGFSFSGLQSYEDFFDMVSTNGIYNPFTGYCIVPAPVSCIAIPKNAQIEIMPEPTTMALLGMGAFFICCRRKVNTFVYLANC